MYQLCSRTNEFLIEDVNCICKVFSYYITIGAPNYFQSIELWPSEGNEQACMLYAVANLKEHLTVYNRRWCLCTLVLCISCLLTKCSIAIKVHDHIHISKRKYSFPLPLFMHIAT